MKEVLLVLSYIPLAFSAFLPVINPIGSAVIFLGLAEGADHATRKRLARGIAINTVLFLAVVLFTGTQILHFFGISLPIVQIAGGVILASMGWSTLNQQDGVPDSAGTPSIPYAKLDKKVFYPLTFPVTTGPGCIVVALTLSAHASRPTFLDTLFAHLGVLIGIALIGVVVNYSYAYADKTTSKIPPPITEGILRVVSFILFCIGAEITWHGVETLIKTMR
jgi:multiple antibiotic resistance protein